MSQHELNIRRLGPSDLTGRQPGETFEEQLTRELTEYQTARDEGQLPVAPICRQRFEPMDAGVKVVKSA